MYQIREWLYNPKRTWIEGVRLYNQVGDDFGLKLLLKKGESTFAMTQLIAGLKKFEPKPEENPQPAVGRIIKVNKSITTHLPPKQNAPQWSSYPSRIQGLFTTKAVLFKKAQMLRAEMDVLPETDEHNAERKWRANEIESLFEKIGRIWEDINFFDANGTDRPEVDRVNVEQLDKLSPPMEGEETYEGWSILRMKKREDSLMAAISRYRKQGKVEKAEEYEVELKRLRILINDAV